MTFQKLRLRYIRGKQVICLTAIIISIVGFMLDAVTYFSVYSGLHIGLQSITVFLFCIALILFLKDKNRYYVFAFALLAYGFIFNVLVTSIVPAVHSAASYAQFTQANILSRALYFVIIYIVLSGFIIGRRHIFMQGLLLLSLVLYFILVLHESFFVANAPIYIVSTLAFLYVLHFFVGILENLIYDLGETGKQESGKNQNLVKFQNSLLDLTKDETLFRTNLNHLFSKICLTAIKNLNTNRVSVWMLEDNNQRLTRKQLFEVSGGNDEQIVLERKNFPVYFKALEDKPFIMAKDACEHPDTKEFADVYLKPLAICSMLDCPIVMDGKPVGVICCEHQHAYKDWTSEDVLFVQSLSGHIAIFYKNLEINDLLSQVQARNFELVEKSNEIETMNEELNALNEELSTINETLETTVQKRTSELETQNKQLTEYAFINSHILRAPLARILGLAHLILSTESNAIQDKDLLKGLIHASNELDVIIRKISDILYDGNNLSREDIQAIINRTIHKN